MAPTKLSTRPLITIPNRISTRSKGTHLTIKGKRKADTSPTNENAVKRSAFGDVTNAVSKNKTLDEKSKLISKHAITKKVVVQSKVLPSVRTVTKPKQNENVAPPAAPSHKVLTRASLRLMPAVPNQTALKGKEAAKEVTGTTKVKTRLSNEFEKTEESLYSTALEDISASSSEGKQSCGKNASTKEEKMSISMVAQQMEQHLNLGNHDVPEGVHDFDKENWDDVFQISHYAMDIFNYLKTREHIFVPRDYIENQPGLTRWMRSLLIDWMVEIQESFELNHETLYLGVKMVDLYLSKVTVNKDTLQLVGAAAMFIASKYDERIPPMVNDFLYICDGAYSRRELLRMEINILKICGYDLGIPLSYRFLRRYARCSKVTMPVLTLARYILEYSLMDYAIIQISDSKLAAASLYLALQMKHVSSWTKTHQFYTGYAFEDIKSTIYLLNNGLHRKPKEQLMTVRNKYSHKIFFEVAKTALIDNSNLKP